VYSIPHSGQVAFEIIEDGMQPVERSIVRASAIQIEILAVLRFAVDYPTSDEIGVAHNLRFFPSL